MHMQRKIIHVDCDCFYAAVEMRDQPAWHTIPLAVGGPPDARGVIATCNYLARRDGVHSAMASAQALKRCPSLLIVPPDMARYRAASEDINAIYRAYTDLIEPLSLDEAFLDVSQVEHCAGSATRMAQAIRSRIREEVGITASAGVAPNKFLAKIASDWNKPDGLCVVRPDQVASFVAALPVGRLFGVGKVTAARMHALGLITCADVQTWELARLIRHFGRFGARLYELARGIDHRPVECDRARLSISVETTYPADLPTLAACQAELPALLAQLKRRLIRYGSPSFKQIVLKLKFNDFQQTTAESGACRLGIDRTLGRESEKHDAPTCESSFDPRVLQPQIPNSGKGLELARYTALLDTSWRRGQRPVRLLGVGVRLAPPLPVVQLTLFND